MKLLAIRLAILVPAVVLCATCAYCETNLIVDYGPYASAQEASSAQDRVNWLDDDATDDATCTECFAALELQHYLRKMSGRKEDFKIHDDQSDPGGSLILIGGLSSNTLSRQFAPKLDVSEASFVKLGPQGYRIAGAKVDGRRITLVAGSDRAGTLYGCYDLLYRLGCRWFAPGEMHEVVPHVDQIPDLDVAQGPSFSLRGFRGRWDRPKPSLDFWLWMARNRLNFWSNDLIDPALAHKLGIRMAGGGHRVTTLFLEPKNTYPYDHPKFQGNEANPKDPYPVSEHFQGDANQDGRLSYFEAHPEWYARIKGRRIPGVNGEHGTNFCTSNPQAVAELSKNFVEALADGIYRDADIVHFWTLDNGKWCQCEQCKAVGTRTDRYLKLVHDVDQYIKKAQAEGKIHRPITLLFLVYLDVLEPPTHPLPADFDYNTCIGTFFPIRRCYVHNFDDASCDTNAKYAGQLHGWAVDPQRHYQGQLMIGEYYNVSAFRGLPVCFMHTMANDIPHYWDKAGARSFHYMHCSTGNWGTKALTNFQMARQLWDKETDCELLWDDYFTQRYGSASDTMRPFYLSQEKMLSNINELRYLFARRLAKGAKNLFPGSHLRYRRASGTKGKGPTLVEMLDHARRCRELIDQAMAAELPEPIHSRIAEDERMYTYGELTLKYYDACVQAFELGRSGRLDEARRQYAEARRVADLLRKDTTSSIAFSRTDGAKNALDATCAAGALKRLDTYLKDKEAKK